MPTVKVRDGDNFEGAMRKFKRLVDKGKILNVVKSQQFHVKDSKLKQLERAAARKRLAKQLSRDRMNFRDMHRSSKSQVSLTKTSSRFRNSNRSQSNTNTYNSNGSYVR